ncbi:MAG: response regulator transcription factor [Hyphomicrobiales bacterium]|nr:response regulator transcription factor [Hyphomicrobiales bacterium]
MNEKTKTILVVDDDPKVRQLLRRCFEMENYLVLEADNADAVHACLQEGVVDLITLDLNLGLENGLDIAADLRTKSDVPIIIVTGKGDVIDRVVGLEMGADDYIAKPFHIREVLARVRSVIRRSQDRASFAAEKAESDVQQGTDKVFQVNGWTVCPSRFELKDSDGKSHKLTANDFKLLLVFLESPKRVLSRDQIMDQMNGQDWTPFDRTIDNQIARLRKKIEPDPNNPKIIKTVRGVGYMLAADVTAVS